MATTAAEMQPFIVSDMPEAPRKRKRVAPLSMIFKKLKTYNAFWFLLCVLSMGIILSAAFVTLLYVVTQPPAFKELALPGLDIDPLGAIPTHFDLHAEYTGPPSNTSDELWHAMIPKGKGFISLDKLKAAEGLPESIANLDIHNDGTLCVSVFHQLHCLDMLRKGIYSAIDGNPVRMSHMAHCFDYLRQAILCAADTALEAPTIMQGHLGVDGWNVTHKCRNFGAVFDWTERLYYKSPPLAFNEAV